MGLRGGGSPCLEQGAGGVAGAPTRNGSELQAVRVQLRFQARSERGAAVCFHVRRRAWSMFCGFFKEMAQEPRVGGAFSASDSRQCGLGGLPLLNVRPPAGPRGSVAARVFKLFRSEHGEYFNVSSSSEWVQGEASGTAGETRRRAEGQGALCAQDEGLLRSVRPRRWGRVPSSCTGVCL